MSIDNLLARLDGVRRTGPSTFIALAPTRRERRPSLSIRLLDDGRIIIHDFGGDSTEEILAAIGLTFADLMPERLNERMPRERRPFSAADVLRCLYSDALFLSVVASDLNAGKAIAESDRAELINVAGRVGLALEASGL